MIDLAALSDWIEKRVQSYKRERRIRHAITLPTIEARILHATPALTREMRFEIQLAFRFEAGAEAAYGSAFSVPVDGENYARMLAAKVADGSTLQVRYNPVDPFENYALAQDNVDVLPFALAD